MQRPGRFILVLWMGALSLVLLAGVELSAQQQGQTPQAQGSDKKDKKDKKKKPKEEPDANLSEVFSEKAAGDVLAQIRDGLEGHSTRTLLGAFDEDMDGYLSFEDAIEALFRRYESFTCIYRILQSSAEGDKGYVDAEFQLTLIVRESGAVERRRQTVRFTLQRNKKGWHVLELTPRDFFS